MANLGRVAMTHFASLPTKSLEARYWGIPFAERFGSLFRGLTHGSRRLNAPSHIWPQSLRN
ncbi:MAG TPA: hypothetical protein VG274_06585 [Rhizomicrobium sp.]|nr:hypothetical protein [Rhizomicrobium sp.]